MAKLKTLALSILPTILTTTVEKSAGFSLPQNASDPVARAAAIRATQAGFFYGNAVAGGPSYPSGLLGDAKVAEDVAAEQLEALPEIALITDDSTIAAATSAKVSDCVLTGMVS